MDPVQVPHWAWGVTIAGLILLVATDLIPATHLVERPGRVKRPSGPAGFDVRVVQVERGALGPDPRYRCAHPVIDSPAIAIVVATMPSCITGHLNGWATPQMLRRYGASARSARARRTYDAS